MGPKVMKARSEASVKVPLKEAAMKASAVEQTETRKAKTIIDGMDESGSLPMPIITALGIKV